MLAAALGLVLALSMSVGAASAQAAAPTVTIKSNPEGRYTTAILEGTITPGTQEVSVYGEYRTLGSTEAWSATFFTSLESSAGPTAVSGEITNLSPGTQYEARLDAYVPGEGEFYSSEPNPKFSTKTVTKPTVSENDVTGIGATQAFFSGTVRPNAPGSAPQDPGFNTKWIFLCIPECNQEQGFTEITGDNRSHQVSLNAAGLEPNTSYEVRLFAENGGGSKESAPRQFRTLKVAPAVLSVFTPTVDPEKASVAARVDSENDATMYFIEYGLTEAYGLTTSRAPLPATPRVAEAAATLEGLVPGNQYHWRIVAENSAGSIIGPDRTFTTPGSTAVGPACPNEVFRQNSGALLPDCRAYEQVSPTAKNGGSVSGGFFYQAAAGGDAVTFYANAPLPGSRGAQGFPTYLARRSSDGWDSEDLLPPAQSGPVAEVLGWSEDLKQSYVAQAARSPLLGTLFLQDETGAASAIASPVNAGPGAVEELSYGGTSADDSIVLFDSASALAPGATAGVQNVYVWDRSRQTVYLVGTGNGEASAAFEQGTAAGSGQPQSQYLQSENALSETGREVFFTSLAEGQLYVRVNPAADQSAVRQGKCVDTASACTYEISARNPGVAEPTAVHAPTFWGASRDGSGALFTSPSKLTADASTGSQEEGSDLYQYDVGTKLLSDLTPDPENPIEPAGAEVQGVLGQSQDGSFVYFVANGVLAAGATHGDCHSLANFQEPEGSGHCNLYVWHKGASPPITFVAPMRFALSEEETTEHAVAATDVQNIIQGPRIGVRDGKTSRVDSDGRVLLFRTTEPISEYANRGVPEFYRYEYGGRPVCISCDPSGASPIGAPSLQSIKAPFEERNLAPVLPRNLDSDGSRIIFESPDPLVSADQNGALGCPEIGNGEKVVRSCQDVYEWEAPGTGTCQSATADEGCISLLSPAGDEPSYLDDASETGDDVFLFTGSPLVGQDSDDQVDLYDARVDGGLASQYPVAGGECDGESCRGPAPAPNPSATPTTQNVQGRPVPKPRKKRHRHRRTHRRQHHHGRRPSHPRHSHTKSRSNRSKHQTRNQQSGGTSS